MKQIRVLLKTLEDRGFTVEKGRGGHYKVKGQGWVVTISQSPKDADTCVKQAKRDLRRAGVDISSL